MDRACIDAVKANVQSDLGLTDAQIGRVFAEFSHGCAACQPPGGALADRFGPGKLLTAIVHLHSTYSVAVSCQADVDPADVLPALNAYYMRPRTRSRNSKRPRSCTCCSAAARCAWLAAERDDTRAAEAAGMLDRAVGAALLDPANHTRDLGGGASTTRIAEAVADSLGA